MASSAAKTPLQHYLPIQGQLDKELATILYDASAHAEKTILSYEGKAGIGAAVDRAQLRQMKKVLDAQAADYWNGIGHATAGQYGPAAAAAAAVDAPVPGLPPIYEKAKLLQAVDNVPTLIARGVNNIPLAESVYGSMNIANGYVDQTINRGILLGRSAKQIAADVSHLIRPDVRGGVSYAAYRLGRTELNNAFHRSYVNQHQDEPWVAGMKWHLSGSHPVADECNEYAESSHFKGGEAGVFRTDEVPGKPHPQCLCYVTTVQLDEDEFIEKLANGDFDEHIDSTIYGNRTPGRVC